MRLGRSNDRVLLADNDSVVQRELYETWQALPAGKYDDHLDIAVGRLRLETLLSQWLVLTDSQLLDGPVFAELVSSGRLAMLGRRPAGDALPVEVRSRADTLEASLRQMHAAPAGFLPSLVDRDNQQHTWQQMYALADSGALTVVRWKDGSGLPFAESEAWFPRAVLRADTLRTEAGREAFDAILAGSALRRSPVYAGLAARRPDATPELANDLNWIQWWYDETYRRALAFQHSADYRGSDQGQFGHNVMHRLIDTPDARHLVTLSLPAGMLTFLGNWEQESWAQFQRDRQGHLRRWWTVGDLDSLRRILDDLASACDRWGGTAPTVGQTVKMFGTLNATRALLKIGAAASQALPNGTPISIALSVAEAALELRRPKTYAGSTVEVTSYFDDVSPR